ncbi:hypothetical protein GCM10008965_18900 [Methylorubrum aminovorans]|nr:hypothetical protein GCM10025880_52040 [Methylorubrum aminovorans]
MAGIATDPSQDPRRGRRPGSRADPTRSAWALAVTEVESPFRHRLSVNTVRSLCGNPDAIEAQTIWRGAMGTGTDSPDPPPAAPEP